MGADLGPGQFPRENQSGHLTVTFTKGFSCFLPYLSLFNPTRAHQIGVGFISALKVKKLQFGECRHPQVGPGEWPTAVLQS